MYVLSFCVPHELKSIKFMWIESFSSVVINNMTFDANTVKTATLIFVYGRGTAISSAKVGKSGSTYNLVN